MTQNRRQFSRIQFATDARLYWPSAEVDVKVIDLSLRGALVEPPVATFIPVGSGCTLRIRLDEFGTMIRMEGTVVHRQGPYCGIFCQEIDLDSITHLRRLIELNLGNESLLARELTMLGT